MRNSVPSNCDVIGPIFCAGTRARGSASDPGHTFLFCPTSRANTSSLEGDFVKVNDNVRLCDRSPWGSAIARAQAVFPDWTRTVQAVGRSFPNGICVIGSRRAGRLDLRDARGAFSPEVELVYVLFRNSPTGMSVHSVIPGTLMESVICWGTAMTW